MNDGQRRIVDIAQIVTSADAKEVLVTYALGSCIAVVLWDPVLHVGGMIHYMLPLSSINPQKAESQPAMFADTGVPLLFKEMYRLGSKKEHLVVRVAGGSQVYDGKGLFDIGYRNYTVVREILKKNNVLISKEDVGGNRSRTVYLWLETGKCLVKSACGLEIEL